MNNFSCFRIAICSALVIFLIAGGCSDSGQIREKLDAVESIMESHPDSALHCLESIPISKLKGNSEKARYALLKSMALDKNYIDTTTFDVLQPAIEYYKKHGSTDEKFRTYYYEGRIFQNAGKDSEAMQSFLKARDLERRVTDSLTLARLLVGQAAMYYKQYKISEFTETNLKAAEIFKALGKSDATLRRYCCVLDGEVILRNKTNADSIYKICRKLYDKDPKKNVKHLKQFLKYATFLGTDDQVRALLTDIEESGINNKDILTVAQAYVKLGNTQEAENLIKDVYVEPTNVFDSLSYLIISAKIHEAAGNYEASCDMLRKYTKLLAASDLKMYTNELLFSEKKHEMELASLVGMQKKDRLIWICVGVAVFLLCLSGLIFYRYRLNRAARRIAEYDAECLRLNEAILKSEKKNVELELESTRLEYMQLEDERDRLNALLEEQKELKGPLQKVIQKRLELLNGLLAKEISENESYAKPYREWIESIRKNRKSFMATTRMAFKASHPKFIKYLEDHSLTEEEINYVCLYALGLKGKEVGEYIRLKRHYNVSSTIRKKLGIDEHAANLGPYIRSILDPNS